MRAPSTSGYALIRRPLCLFRKVQDDGYVIPCLLARLGLFLGHSRFYGYAKPDLACTGGTGSGYRSFGATKLLRSSKLKLMQGTSPRFPLSPFVTKQPLHRRVGRAGFVPRQAPSVS